MHCSKRWRHRSVLLRSSTMSAAAIINLCCQNTISNGKTEGNEWLGHTCTQAAITPTAVGSDAAASQSLVAALHVVV